MECVHQRPLKQTPDAFDAVGMYIGYTPIFDGMIDGFVPCVLISDPGMGSPFVCIDGFSFVLDCTLMKP